MKKRYRDISVGALVAAMAVAGATDAAAFGSAPAGMSEYVAPTPGGMLERARKMMESGNYAGVVDEVRSLRISGITLRVEESEECDYMLARALYERGDETCLSALADFCSRYPASTRTPEATLLQGDFYYFHDKFGPAAGIYLKCDINGLDKHTKALYTFRKGVSLTKAGLYAEARSALGLLRSNPEYSLRARFYLAYIRYVKGDYDAAYDEFANIEGEGGERVVNAPRDSRRSSDYTPTGFEAGYYMAQIDYLRQNWERVITRGTRLLDEQPVDGLKPELYRIVGESCFKSERTEEAARFLARYLESCQADDSTPKPTAIYAMGAIRYAQGDYDEAVQLLERIADSNDELGQSANLYLGQCYMHEGDNSAAALAFDKAYKLRFNSKVSETALYNYIAARTRGGNVPFSSAIPMLEEFLSRFPHSEFAPAVEEYLATAYYNEKDYSKAMASIERIPNPGNKVLAARQKVAYELGIECLTNDNAAAAAKYMEIAGEKHAGGDAAIVRESKLWLGDALYADAKYAKATAAYESYLREARKDANRTLALYNLGYSLYMEKKYSQGAARFGEALKASPSLPSQLHTDATIRMADCLYYTGDTRAAIDSYSRAIQVGATDADYALLRRAMTHGSAGDKKSKIDDLRTLLKSYPDSKWAPQALLEQGIAFTDMGDNSNATSTFEQLASRFPASPEARKGWLNLAILRHNAGATDDAIEAYKQLIRSWPSSEEASMASDDLRKIYASRGNLHQLAAWLAEVPGAPQLDTDEIERLAFDAAGRALNDNPDDTSHLEKYIADYPDGQYLAQALYDLTDTYYANGDYDKALSRAELLLKSRPDSRQAPAVLCMKAEILERYSEGKRSNEAFEAWRELERCGGAEWTLDAYAGIMRTAPDAQTSLDYAHRLRRSGGLGTEQAEETDLYEALALMNLNHEQEARDILGRLAKNPSSEAGARAAYELGQNLLDDGQTDKAQKILTNFTDAGSPHQYWLARGFIALADTFHAQGKTYLGREYLSSLRQNYPGDEVDIKEMIDTRLNNWKSK